VTAPDVDLTPPSRALAIGAHPDDVEFGCGGTLAKWARAGTAVELLVLTDGSKGSWDPEVDVSELAGRRRVEQRAAADVLGIGAIHFLDAVDGELEHDAGMRRRVCEVIRTARPDIVLGHDPWKRYRLHPDHLHAGQLAIDGIVAARDPHFFPDTGVPHRPERLLLFEAELVDHLEDVESSIDTKVTALLEHRSQWRSTMGIDADDPAIGAPAVTAQRQAFEQRVRAVAAEAGAPAGLACAEAFKLLDEL
jgi:LmbE family N-acetylglucosaminyl deacetylase